MNIFNNTARTLVTTAAALAICTFATSALAVPTTDGFESGLAGWLSFGDVATRSGGPAVPASGNAYALLTSATLGADDFSAASAAFNFSGVSAVSSAAMESALGVAVGTLDPDLDNFVFATEGSLLQRSFAVSAGETLSFKWNFLSNEGSAGALADYAFVSLGGSVFRLADTSSNLSPASVFTRQTGYRDFSYTFANTGNMTIGFGVVDVNDGSVTSALAIDNVQISAVPESSLGVLLSLGLGVIGLARIRRRMIA